MALFESYERRIDQINAVLNSYGISSIEEAEKITKDAGLDVYDQVKKIQPICFENACWAYTVGAAIAIKKGCRRAADAAAAIGEGLQAFCIPGSVADHRKVGLGHGNLGKMLLEEETECFCFLAGHDSVKESPLGQLTDYQLPLVVFKGVEYEYLSMFGLFYGLLNCNGDFPEYDQFVEALAKLPDTLVDAQKKFDEPADAIAKKYFNADYMMWIGSGELWGEVYLFSMCILEEMQWIRTKSITSPEFFHGTLELVEKDMPVFLVKSAGVYRTLDERAEKFLKEHTDNLIVIDVMDYMIPGLKPEFAPLVAPIISTAVLNGRLSKHIESYTGHDLDMRRYYRQFEY